MLFSKHGSFLHCTELDTAKTNNVVITLLNGPRERLVSKIEYHLPFPCNIIKVNKGCSFVVGDNVVFAVVATVLGMCALLSVLMALYISFRKKNRYERLIHVDSRLRDHFHKSLRNCSEKDRESTFNGVAIPLIRKVSKL